MSEFTQSGLAGGKSRYLREKMEKLAREHPDCSFVTLLKSGDSLTQSKEAAAERQILNSWLREAEEK